MIVPLALFGIAGYGLYRLAKHSGMMKAPTYAFAKGDQADAVAARFSTTIAAIQKANGNSPIRLVAPDGSTTSIYLPPGAKDTGARPGAQGKAVL